MAEVTLPNGQVIEVADDAESYQVTVSLPSGFTTTANALTRAGESSSELERLLAGEIPGREGYEGATDIFAGGGGLISEAEKKARELLAEFTTQNARRNVYSPPSADVSPAFEDANEEYVPTFDEAMNLYPYYPENLIRKILDVWTDTGEISIALSEARASDDFEKSFPGIKRPDGSLRMTEIEYLETKDYMQDALRTYNLNPGVFDQEIATAISGDVSAREFEGRLQFAYNQLFDNIPQVKEIYMQQNGIDLSDEAIFAMFLSPELSESVLQNQILVSQISADSRGCRVRYWYYNSTTVCSIRFRPTKN